MRTQLALILAVLPLLTFAQSEWKFGLNGGIPYNFPMPLLIKQEGYATIHTWARYFSEPFTLPVYWTIKLLRQSGSTNHELELMHHKLYLRNKPDDVQHFGISHGFNLLFFNRGSEKRQFTHRFGGGIIIAHPESEIREKIFGDAADPYDMGYYITGPAVQYSINKLFPSNSKIQINTELKLLAAYSYTPIADGKAHVIYLGLHLIAGLQGRIYQTGK